MTVLIVVDVQEKYLADYDSALPEKVNTKIKCAKEAGSPVIYVKNTGRPENEPQYKLADNLLVVSKLIFEKCRPSAFSNDAFAQELKVQRADTLEIIGIDGSCCVAETAMDAVGRGYSVKVLLPYVGARNPGVFAKAVRAMRESGVMVVEE